MSDYVDIFTDNENNFTEIKLVEKKLSFYVYVPIRNELFSFHNSKYLHVYIPDFYTYLLLKLNTVVSKLSSAVQQATFCTTTTVSLYYDRLPVIVIERERGPHARRWKWTVESDCCAAARYHHSRHCHRLFLLSPTPPRTDNHYP